MSGQKRPGTHYYPLLAAAIHAGCGNSDEGRRLRVAMANSPIFALRQEVASIGHARADASCEPLIEAADRALYQAKLEGRNRVATGGQKVAA